MKMHLYTNKKVACGEIPAHSPMCRDPAAVDCQACKRTRLYKKLSVEKLLESATIATVNNLKTTKPIEIVRVKQGKLL